MAWRRPTKQPWDAIRIHLPQPKASPRGGRRRVDNRRCLEGILWILWTGAPQLTLHQTIADPARVRLEEAAIARHRDYYLTLVKQGRNRYDWWLICDVYAQIRQAWQHTLEDASLLDWLSALYPYFNGRNLWQEYPEWANRALAMVVRQGMRKKEGP